MDIMIKTASKWLQGVGTLALAHGISIIYEKQYKKIKSLKKEIKQKEILIEKQAQTIRNLAKGERQNGMAYKENGGEGGRQRF